MLWEPPSIESANLSISYREFMESTFDVLSTQNEAMKRHSLGHDSSGKYPIYGYSFGPLTNPKMIAITAGIHGDEPEGYWGLYHMMVLLLTSQDPAIVELRESVTFLIMPLVSPWGYTEFTRENANGININRNFDVNWMVEPRFSESSDQSTPFSEAEAACVKAFFMPHKDNIAFHMDLHTVPPQYYEAGMYIGYSYVKPTSKLYEPMTLIQGQVIDYWQETMDWEVQTIFQQTSVSNCSNYFEDVLRIPSVNLEFVSLNFGELADASEMTEAVRWYMNVLLHLAHQTDLLAD